MNEKLERSDNFKTVTTVGNRAVAALARAAKNSDPDEIIGEIPKVLPEAIQELVNVTFEKAGLSKMIEEDENFEFYRNLPWLEWLTVPSEQSEQAHAHIVQALDQVILK